MSDAPFVSWASVRPKLDDELASIKEALIVAPLADVRTLQAQAQALAKVRAWFEAGARHESRIMGDDARY